MLHLSPVTMRNIVSDHKHAFNSIYQTWHLTPDIPSLRPVVWSKRGGRGVRKLWSQLDGLGHGFTVRWSTDIRKEGLRRRWVCTVVSLWPWCRTTTAVSCLWTIEKKRGPIKVRQPYFAPTSQGALNKWDWMIKGSRLYVPFSQSGNPSLFNKGKAGGHIKAVYERLTWAASFFQRTPLEHILCTQILKTMRSCSTCLQCCPTRPITNSR